MFKKSNIPNILTVIRVLLVPVIIALAVTVIIQGENTPSIIVSQNHEISILLLVSGVIFILASFTDFLDGYIARKYEYVSDFGKFFDPIADKLLVNSVLILFVPLHILPFWITLILILRDTIVDFIRMILSSKQITLSAGLLGKLKTVFQMVGLSILFFVSPWVLKPEGLTQIAIQQVIWIPMYVALIFSITSGVIYFIKAKKNLF